MNRIMIAGTNSGVGKTTISMGIMAALKKRGLKVAPFKTGPDYIDPGFHRYVTSNPSYNLDSYLLKESVVSEIFSRAMKDKDIGIIEGVMGLYDGLGIHNTTASSAHISKITKTPVILVIDATGMSNSAGALVLGYKKFDEKVPIKGVIINRVSSDTHYQLLKEIIETNTKIPCVGYLPKNLPVQLKSRHLGLIPVEELKELDEQINKLVEVIEESVDIDKLIDISKSAELLKTSNFYEESLKKYEPKYRNKKIGIAWDKAFSFYYQANIDVLKSLGAKLIKFSPLEDKKLPEGLDSIFIGGGYPEVFAKELNKNKFFIDSLKEYLENGGKCYAECGGFMYLTKGIKLLTGDTYSMVGFLPGICEMTDRLQRFGYAELNIDFSGKIYTSRVHEFHYSKHNSQGENLDYKYLVKKYRDDKLIRQWSCGIEKKNTIAGYAHLYFLSNLELMSKLI